MLAWFSGPETFEMRFHQTVCVLALLATTYQPLLAQAEKTKSLPSGTLSALASDEAAYCDQYLDEWKKSCHQTFRSNLRWHEVVITPSGQTAILVENHNLGSCGSAGCSLYLFLQQQDEKFIQILDKHGETGALDEIERLKTLTNGHYDLQKTWRDGQTKTIYRWNGKRYGTGRISPLD